MISQELELVLLKNVGKFNDVLRRDAARELVLSSAFT